ncbi:hypothetical protein [Paenibacillus spiritus]|nr:hypothetical protein [Paenibacillus spiritus]
MQHEEEFSVQKLKEKDFIWFFHRFVRCGSSGRLQLSGHQGFE